MTCGRDYGLCNAISTSPPGSRVRCSATFGCSYTLDGQQTWCNGYQLADCGYGPDSTRSLPAPEHDAPGILDRDRWVRSECALRTLLLFGFGGRAMAGGRGIGPGAWNGLVGDVSATAGTTGIVQNCPAGDTSVHTEKDIRMTAKGSDRPAWLDRFDVRRKSVDVWEGASLWRRLAGVVYAVFQVEVGPGSKDPFFFQVSAVTSNGQWRLVYRAATLDEALLFKEWAAAEAATTDSLPSFLKRVEAYSS